MEISQYQIFLVNLDPTIGSEIKKTRPCVIISPNEMNDNLRTVTIAPMTTKSRKYPTRIKIKHNNKTYHGPGNHGGDSDGTGVIKNKIFQNFHPFILSQILYPYPCQKSWVQVMTSGTGAACCAPLICRHHKQTVIRKLSLENCH